MKCLATCKPTEFVSQTAKIKDVAAKFMEATEILKIRETKPIYEMCPADATPEQQREIIMRNAEREKEQAMKNLNKILDNILVNHPKETLELLALCCFVEPERVDDYTIDEYFQCIMDMFSNKSVVNFFSLLAQIQTPHKAI